MEQLDVWTWRLASDLLWGSLVENAVPEIMENRKRQNSLTAYLPYTDTPIYRRCGMGG